MIIDFKKIMNFHKLPNFTVNNVLRINCTYNGYQSFLIYSNDKNLEWTFTIFWNIDNVIYCQNYRVSWNKKEKVFTFNPYLETEIFDGVKKIFNYSKKETIKDYFKKLLLKLDDAIFIPETQINFRNYGINANQNNIYFSHFQRRNMSEDMFEKLKKYGLTKNQVSQIKNNGFTGFFVKDISRAKDLKLSFKESFIKS